MSWIQDNVGPDEDKFVCLAEHLAYEDCPHVADCEGGGHCAECTDRHLRDFESANKVAGIIEQIQERKLFVDGGPTIDTHGAKRGMFWIVTDKAVDSPRGSGSTLEEAYRDWERKMLL